MNFSEIPIPPSVTVHVTLADGNVLPANFSEEAVTSINATALAEEYELHTSKKCLRVAITNDTDVRKLRNTVASGRPFLANLRGPIAPDNSVELQVILFGGASIVEMEDIEVGIDEEALQGVARISGEKSIPLACQWLDSHCRISHGGKDYFLFSSGAAARDFPDENEETKEGDNQTSADDNEKNIPHTDGAENEDENSLDNEGRIEDTPEKKTTRAFAIYGDSVRFAVSEHDKTEKQKIFLASKITRNKNRDNITLLLARGKLIFKDWTATGGIRLLAQAQMRELTKESNSYLKKWDEFGKIEGDMLLARIQEIGAIRYSKVEHSSKSTDEYVLHLNEITDRQKAALIKGVEGFELVREIPDYVSKQMTWEEFCGRLKEEAFFDSWETADKKKEKRKKKKKHGEDFVSAAFVAFDADHNFLTIKIAAEPDNGLSLVYSVAGERVQIERRMVARERILRGRSANPNLDLLIEENGKPPEGRHSKTIPALSAFVRGKIFKNPPTPMQEKAIEVALNTPDIALIQGPPGTGKTTVITGILERLNELADKRGNIKGRVLLTGFQHDAVENMINRMAINSLPVPKYGKRNNGELDDAAIISERLERWCSDIAKHIREKNPQIKISEDELLFQKLSLQYANVPTRSHALMLLGKALEQPSATLGEELFLKLKALNDRFLIQEENARGNNDTRLSDVIALRVSEQAFGDDAHARAADVLGSCGELLSSDEQAFLRKIISTRTQPSDAVLSQLRALKRDLLAKLTPPPMFRREKANEEIIDAIREVVARIRNCGLSTKDRKSAILAELLSELDNNPQAIQNAVSEYSYAFAATCQQSVGGNMQHIKLELTDDEINKANKEFSYDYVIVDEAARVSPRDLLIPMAQGAKIILVGDHRQLPHIIDDEVAKAFDSGESSLEGKDEQEWLKQSLFQYLFEKRLPQLESSDSIQRCVTLDRQYRMHPILGDFISRNFYERFKASEKFDFGLPPEKFVHNLPDTNNKPMVWIDVPHTQGYHKKSGSSWTRPVEAKIIAEKLNRWLNSPEGQNLSFGVISFYKAQSELLLEELARYKITERKGDKFVIAEQYKYLPVKEGKLPEERLRIGTVDSFQGMEFDVVFLSLVRTESPHRSGNRGNAESDNEERLAHRTFGHLCLYNRLNVSMSRQKRLLVMVGDSALVQTPLAKKFIPGLADFYRLCQQEGVIIQ